MYTSYSSNKCGSYCSKAERVEEAKGDWICFVDGDDVLPKMLFVIYIGILLMLILLLDGYI